VPDINPMIDRAPSQPAHIITAHGPLSAVESDKAIAALGIHGRKLAEMERHLAVEQRLDHTPIIADNQTHVLRDGYQSFPAIFELIRNAKHHINMEYYIFEDIQSGGMQLSDLLVEKKRQGVAVNIIYDSYGSDDTPDALFDKLRQAGINLIAYNPLNPFATLVGYNPDSRDHRKILIVDGATAVTGGVNLSTTYLSGPGKSQAPNDSELPSYWRDTDVEIKGPAVAELQKLFMAHWQAQEGPALADADYFPVIQAQGPAILHIMGSTPDEVKPAYYATLVSAMRTATTRIWLHTAYFVPTAQEKQELINAAQRGVDVRLILPEKSDSSLALAFQHSVYGDLIAAGVKIYEIHNVVLHSKTITIDGVWSVLGSSNFDHRSVILNDEVDTVVIGREFAEEMEQLFQDDVKKSRLITIDDTQNQDFIESLKEFYVTAWEDEL
jgi:cardiolipin synthase